MKAVLDGGKYEVEFNESNGTFKAKRYGEDWRNLTGDGLVLAMLYRIAALEEALSDQAPASIDQPALNPLHHPLANQHPH